MTPTIMPPYQYTPLVEFDVTIVEIAPARKNPMPTQNDVTACL